MKTKSKAAKAKKNVKPPRVATVTIANVEDTYKIEDAPAISNTKASRIELEKRTRKLKNTVKKVEIGQAFIVPKDEVAWVTAFLKKEFPNRHYRTMSISKDSKFKRIIYKS